MFHLIQRSGTKVVMIINKNCPSSIRRRLSIAWRKISDVLLKSKIKKTREIFGLASETPVWLGQEELLSLHKKYPYPPKHGYDPYSVQRRGQERAKEICRIMQKKEPGHRFLELGCQDGMVSCYLQNMGKMTTAIDICSEGFDKRAAQAGVNLIPMDCAHLQFEDEAFDVVFSYDAFEHFSEPKLALQEAIRVTRKGGYIFLEFAPLYMSPLGLHAYDSISIPYCQFLFSKELLNDFTRKNGKNAINFSQLNMWTVQDYRKLWNAYSNRLNKVFYQEKMIYSHLDLIRKYPSCFKSKTDCFDNLVISRISALFQKT